MHLLKSKYRHPAALPAPDAPRPVAPAVYAEQEHQPGTIKEIYVPNAVRLLWTQFKHPPMVWDRIATHKSVQNCIEPEPLKVVKTMHEWLQDPSGSICRPDESQLERLGTY